MEKVKAETAKVKAEQRTKARTAAKLGKLEQAKKELADLKSGKTSKPETPEETKARIRKNPNPEDVYKHRNLFTDKEIQDLSLRFQNEANIKKNIPEKIDPRKAKIDKLVENIGDITDKAVVVTKGYNMVANVLNAFGVTDLPKISTDIDGKGKDNKSKDKNKDNDGDNQNQNNNGGKPKNKNKGDNKPDSNTSKSADDQAKVDAQQAKRDAKAEARQAKKDARAEARQAKREEKAEARREKTRQQQNKRYAEANELAQQIAKERDAARSEYINKRREEIWNDYANSQQRLSQVANSARLGQQYANRTLSLSAPGNGTKYTKRKDDDD
jgi:hypothetical protein